MTRGAPICRRRSPSAPCDRPPPRCSRQARPPRGRILSPTAVRPRALTPERSCGSPVRTFGTGRAPACRRAPAPLRSRAGMRPGDLLGDARRNLADLRQRREQAALLEVLIRHQSRQRPRRAQEHSSVTRLAPLATAPDRRREDVGVIALARDEGPAVECDRSEGAAAGEDRPPARPWCRPARRCTPPWRSGSRARTRWAAR